LEKNTSEELLRYFGIQTIDIKPLSSNIYRIKVKPDPLFGPLLEIKVPNSQSILRITPLTDRDLDEIMKEMHLDKESGVGQVLGRLSQMIEEIPWLWNLEIQSIIDSIPLITPDIFISIKSGGVERPSY
jgi:acetate---CoA ligase (ADP-forming)